MSTRISPKTDMSTQRQDSPTGMCEVPDLFQVMAHELARARANNTFPSTVAPSTDVQATAHDYELLLQLQHARQSIRNSKPESANHLLVEIARRIRDRDDAYNYEAHRDEAVRRVESYIRSVEHEREYFESVQSASFSDSPPSTPASVTSRCGGSCSAAEVNEDVLSIYELAAEQALSEVTRPLMEGLEQYADMHEEQRGLSNEQKALHHQQVALVASQQVMVDEHDENNQDQRDLIMEMKNHAQGLHETMSTAVSVTNRLSETVTNLPDAIQQIVGTAVQEQTRIAVANVADACQMAINEIEDRKMNLIREVLGLQAEVGYSPGREATGSCVVVNGQIKQGVDGSRGGSGSTFGVQKLKCVAKRILRI